MLQVYGTNSPYHETGPGPAAYHMDRLGWLPIDETLLFGKDGAAAGTYALQPLTGNGTGAVGSYRMISIYVNTSDPFEHVTVELRTKNGVNAGIPNDGQVGGAGLAAAAAFTAWAGHPRNSVLCICELASQGT